MGKNIINSLPKWAKHEKESGVIVVDPAKAYPDYIEQCGLELDKYGVEVARRCCVQDLIEICGAGLHVRFTFCEEMRLVNLPGKEPKGKDAGDAARGAAGFSKHYDELMKKRARSVLIGK